MRGINCKLSYKDPCGKKAPLVINGAPLAIDLLLHCIKACIVMRLELPVNVFSGNLFEKHCFTVVFESLHFARMEYTLFLYQNKVYENIVKFDNNLRILQGSSFIRTLNFCLFGLKCCLQIIVCTIDTEFIILFHFYFAL